MTEPHKQPYRPPKYKTAYRVKNWREYEQSLRDRGDSGGGAVSPGAWWSSAW